MNIYEFARMLNGREVGNEITKEEVENAKENGLVVVFGYSDDNAEFRGAIDDEVGCYDGREVYITPDGLLEECECECKHYLKAKEKSVKLEILWCENVCEIEDYAWTYKIDIPHAEFDILEDGEKWCRGIVFDIKDLGGVKSDNAD